MSIARRAARTPQDFEWVWIWSRQIGEYHVRLEWLKRRYTDKGCLNYSIEWITRDDQLLHTEFGQHQPEW